MVGQWPPDHIPVYLWSPLFYLFIYHFISDHSTRGCRHDSLSVGQEGHYFIVFALHPGHIKRFNWSVMLLSMHHKG